MKIGRFEESGKETFGFVKDGRVATREEITIQQQEFRYHLLSKIFFLMVGLKKL